ncbi:MAG: 50S ribosomal protein L20 [Deltaproteobacteria bacterium]|nr:50S ribosomal protein L20 [Deltaproteobacteria bacterium]
MRVKRGFASRRRHKRIAKSAEGFRGRRKNCFKHVKLGVQKALQHAYKHRRAKKREFRALWIVRINAAARECGISYSKLIRGLQLAKVEIDRKVLAQLAATDNKAFQAVVEKARAAL